MEEAFLQPRYVNGAEIEIRFSGAWYAATVIRTHAYVIVYRLEEEGKRQAGFTRYAFGLFEKPCFITYPKGYEGQISRFSPNIRPRR